MNWIVVIDARAEKDLKRLPVKDNERVKQAIDAMGFGPFSGDIEKLDGQENNWRRRVGNYRIFFEIYKHKNVVYISRIKRRTSNTY